MKCINCGRRFNQVKVMTRLVRKLRRFLNVGWTQGDPFTCSTGCRLAIAERRQVMDRD